MNNSSTWPFKMDPNANFNGQQQPYQYQQQNQQQYPQDASSQQQGYTQQTYTGQPMAQQSTAQPINQPPTQNNPMQQPSTYQSYQQPMVPAGTPAPVANSWNQQMQYSQVTPSIQSQVSTNSATTTTTTTTTKKSTKLKQAFQGRKEPSVASTGPYFSSLMQQSPQKQQAQQQTSIHFSHLMKAAPPPPSQPPPRQGIDFSHLMQDAPPPPPPAQQKPDFSQLMQAAPQPTAFAQRASASSNAQSTTTTSTTSTVGSASRRQAATQGTASLHRFDRDVSVKLKQTVGGTCPAGFDFYAVRQGYLCGGGNHFVEHEDVEAMLKYGRCPRLEAANRHQYDRPVTPPVGNGDGSGGEPAFWTWQQQLDAGCFPFARLKDPRWNPRLNGEGRRR